MTKPFFLNIININSRSDLSAMAIRENNFHLAVVMHGCLKIAVSAKKETVLKRRDLIFLHSGHKLNIVELRGEAFIVEFDPLFFYSISMIAPVHTARHLFYGFKLDKTVKLKINEFIKITRVVEDIHSELKNNKDLLLLQSELNLVLIYAARHLPQDQILRSEAYGFKIISRLKELINLHYRIHRETKWYAKEMGLSIRRLNKLSNVFLKKRVQQLIHERLMLEGEWLLINQEDKLIKEISYELGFEEPGHFTTYFKRIKGLTPLAFRKLHAKL